MLSKVIELCGCMQLIQADCLDVEYKSIKKTLEKIVYNDNIVRIEELALTIEKEGFYKENMIRFFDRTKEILKEKENSNAEKEDSLDMINI